MCSAKFVYTQISFTYILSGTGLDGGRQLSFSVIVIVIIGPLCVCGYITTHFKKGN